MPINFTIVAAVDPEGGIGHEGKLPWNIQSEIAWFKSLTTSGSSNAVIMGRLTWDSLRGPLPGRINIVLSSTLTTSPGNLVCRSLLEALDYCEVNNVSKAWVIGGGKLYQEAIESPFCEALALSRIFSVHAQCDVLFPKISSRFILAWTNVYKEWCLEQYVVDVTTPEYDFVWTQDDPRIEVSRQTLGKQIEQAVRYIKNYDRHLLSCNQGEFWKRADRVIKRRGREIRAAHWRYLANKSRELQSLDQEGIIAKFLERGNQDDSITLRLLEDLEDCNNRRRFNSILRQTVKQWKTDRDCQIKEELSEQIELNRQLMHQMGSKFCEIEVNQRSLVQKGALEYISRKLIRESNYDGLEWLWNDSDKLYRLVFAPKVEGSRQGKSPDGAEDPRTETQG